MNRMKTLGCGLMIALTLFAGCVPSLNPVYEEKNLIFDPAILGVWTKPGTKESWEFVKLDAKSYRLVYTSEQGQIGQFIARLAEVEGELFLDLYPEDDRIDASGFYKFHLVPIHTIYRVRRTPESFALSAIDYKWLDEYLTSHPQEIESATFGSRKMITAATPAVQKFVVAHKDKFTTEFPLQKRELGK